MGHPDGDSWGIRQASHPWFSVAGGHSWHQEARLAWGKRNTSFHEIVFVWGSASQERSLCSHCGHLDHNKQSYSVRAAEQPVLILDIRDDNLGNESIVPDIHLVPEFSVQIGTNFAENPWFGLSRADVQRVSIVFLIRHWKGLCRLHFKPQFFLKKYI
jgi:hypothetical protein